MGRGRSQGPEVPERPASGTAAGPAIETEAGEGDEVEACFPDPFSLPPSHLSRVDLVVHSLKDLPTVLPPGLTIGAICK